MSGVKGRSGAKPKPNSEKQLSKSRNQNKNPVEFDTIKNVAAPKWLPKLAKEMWATVCPHLCKKNVLAVTDLHNLEAFCVAYSTFRMANDSVQKDGVVVDGAGGGPIKNPACTAVNESLRQMAIFGGNLGLDPSSRGRLIGSDKPNTNPFGKF